MNLLKLRGCRQNNLKNINLNLPKNNLIVITGISGSGKSSLAFDTLFAEGQRRFLEYLSPDARKSIKQMPKPDVDFVEGLSPTLAVGQKYGSINPRSTVATHTDLYDFLSLLYAKVGEQHSPATGKPLKRYTRQQMVEQLLKQFHLNSRIQLIAPILLTYETIEEAIKRLQQLGYVRFKINGQEWHLGEPLVSTAHSLDVVVDRIVIKEGVRERLTSSLETTLDLSQGLLKIQEGTDGRYHFFSEVFYCPESGHSFPPLQVRDFQPHSPSGACPKCQGEGGKQVFTQLKWDEKIFLQEQVLGILEMFPRHQKKLYIKNWEAFREQKEISEETYPKKTPFLKEIEEGSNLPLEIRLELEGETKIIQTRWKGLLLMIQEDMDHRGDKSPFSTFEEAKWEICPSCLGGRLKAESLFCLINGKSIHDLCQLTIDELIEVILSWKWENKLQSIVDEIIPEIVNRLNFLTEVELGYLTLDRQVVTLSEGEKQRVQLASQIGSKLSGILYILDEPSRGLHPSNVKTLGSVLKNLTALGNSVVVVEHEKQIMELADHIVELGIGAGVHGGSITYEGNYKNLKGNKDTVCGLWLAGKDRLPKTKKRKATHGFLKIHGVNCHNLVDFSIAIPLGLLVTLSGVSGSGKSTLLMDVIARELPLAIRNGNHPHYSGFEKIQRIVTIGQEGPGLSPRSVPATYIDIMTPLRRLYSETKLSKARGYTPARFSLNKKGGRCEACEGLGCQQVNMHFMPDVLIPCEVCRGKRFNYETLQVTWEGCSIADVLDMSSEKAFALFKHFPTIADKLKLMKELGLEYLTLGQNFTTLSGGEIQRLKLVADLAHIQPIHTLYLLDEPSAGLHFHDIKKLVIILQRLVDAGHSVLMVEHNQDLLSQADYLIELGPGAGKYGGKVISEGPL